ncbi:two-component response regulator, CheY subfamily [Candidatus Scalindua japonica]|uniref:Two-component response regulator, CheY subfamily n=1 Tax=Candidatus Scalindua japonica TaxID=1284222 RepID=A0A286TWT3_9BACT|nr:response regulator [Candidatus Scalindua japonica]GAX60348.1 two-component response regulator, CheY subfamily [Candidatus Scalindua japonica]
MATILIADDEPGMRILIEQTLEPLIDKGVELLLANDGKQALEIIKRAKPDLVLLDVMMPEMSGFDVCNSAKNILGMKDVYILILTAKGQKFDKQMAKDIGVNHYITKPFDLDELLEKVVNILGIEM